MKIFYARKAIAQKNTIDIYEWEVEEKPKTYLIIEPNAWRKKIDKSEIGRANVSDAYGLTAQEAIGAIIRGNKEEMEYLMSKAAQYRTFLESATIRLRVIGDVA